ncbi:putative methyltransferase type 11 [Rosellinia necatrix]|uniref:Putative methyltransferase type 11 n=1 Tax=Rosellinia necatrix TaxID=77044 RepID=A0A1W2TP99_ROSNE|nr:putative methyltransferase type 11 [Rosellinia necatrix]
MPAGGAFARINTAHRVEDWLKSVDDAKTTEASTADQPVAQRRRRCGPPKDADVFTNPYNLLSSPPLTEGSTASSKRKRGAKSTSDALESPIKPQTNVPLGRPSSPRRPRSTSPTKPKSKDTLELLEMPIFVKELDSNADDLPEDVQDLYKQLENARHKENVIPREVRGQVVDMVGEAEARPYCFRSEPTAGAEALLRALCSIRMEARAAQQDECHETGWNHLVHSPILKLVYPSTRLQPTALSTSESASTSSTPLPQRQADARVVPAMSSTIWSEYVPTTASMMPTSFDPTQSQQQRVLVALATGSDTGTSSQRSGPLACSASEATETEQGSNQVASNRGGSKEVDYVLVIDPKDETPLQKVIAYFIHNEAVSRDLLPHVNHTMYRPLKQSPIACSIETKVEFQPHDPLLQLGTWVAAWHKRMRYLRKYIFTESRPWHPDLWHPQRDLDKLPSTLLIEVANHDWRLFFACDRRTSIDIYGPLTIGSTRYLTEAFALVASLEAIKEWIETTFSNGMRSWFMCDEFMSTKAQTVVAESEVIK